MGNWANGYNTDFTYIPYFLRELSPVCIDMALVKSGYKPPKGDSLTYCELGCGLGYTSLILAACFPEMTFYAVDFNSEHIARAKEFVEKAELKNIHFYDLSFEDFSKEDLPTFDYIVAHGVWTWVSESARQDIISLVKDKLNTGGAFYVSYNAMPGSAIYLPLQQIYYNLYHILTGTPKERIGKLMEYVDLMIEKKLAYFEHYPQAIKRHESVKDKSAHYFAHEYLNANWDCFYISDVCESLQDAKVQFVASANLSENATSALFENDCKDLLSFMTDTVSQEQLKDYAQSKMFRKDIFVRGPVRFPALEMVEHINKLRFCVYKDVSDLEPQVSVDGQKVNLPPEGHKRLLELLSKGPKTMQELQQDPLLSQFPFSHLFQMVCCTFEAGQIASYRDAKDIKDKDPAKRLNKVILEQTQYNVGYNSFAMPEFGYGIECGQIDQIFWKAIKDNMDPVQAAKEFLTITQETLKKDGKAITDPREAQELLEDAVDKFRTQRLSYYDKILIAA